MPRFVELCQAQTAKSASKIPSSVRVDGGRKVSFMFITARTPDLSVYRKNNRLSPLMGECTIVIYTPVADIPMGEVVSNVDITVSRGRLMRIRVGDPDGVVPTPFNRRPDRFLQRGFRRANDSNGDLYKPRMASSDGKGHNYELAVPLDIDLDFVADGYNIVLKDEKGAQIKRDKRVPLKTNEQMLTNELKFEARAGH